MANLLAEKMFTNR